MVDLTTTMISHHGGTFFPTLSVTSLRPMGYCLMPSQPIAYTSLFTIIFPIYNSKAIKVIKLIFIKIKPNNSRFLLIFILEMATEFHFAVCVRLWVFFKPPDPSVHVCVFLGWQVRMRVIRTPKNPKFGKFGGKFRASVFKKNWQSIFLGKMLRSPGN